MRGWNRYRARRTGSIGIANAPSLNTAVSPDSVSFLTGAIVDVEEVVLFRQTVGLLAETKRSRAGFPLSCVLVWRRTMYELLVVGDDPAGLATATRAARQGLHVALAYPSVDGLQSSPFLSAALRELVPELAVDFGAAGRSDGKLSADRLRRVVINKVEDIAARQLAVVRSAGVELFRGQPRFLDEHTVEVAGMDAAVLLRAQCIAVATGATFANDLRTERLGGRVVNADQILNVNSMPSRLIVVGADPRAVEFASLFAVGGSRVVVLDEAPPTDNCDGLHDISMAVGVSFRNDAEVVGIDTIRDLAEPDLVGVFLGDGCRLLGDRVLVPGRRIGRTETLNLSAAGLVADDCYQLWCDHQHRTWLPHIYGVGEVVGFSPRDLDAAAQARTVVDAIVHPQRVPMPLGFKKDRQRVRNRANLSVVK